MEITSQVAIISAFGRGHWLAAELAKAQIPTLLIDVTDQMGPWAPEDGEGPFGFFKSEKIVGSLLERMNSDDSLVEAPQGFTFWLEQGPVEMKGPLTKYHLEKMELSSEIREHLFGIGSWCSTAYLANYESKLGNHEQLPLSSAFFIKHATRTGHQRSLDWCRSKNVQVPEKIKVVDLALKDRKTLAGIEVKTDRPGMIAAEQFIWCLSSEEMGMLGAKIQNTLIGKEVFEPEWVWVRYRVKMADSLPRESLPIHCAIIEDLRLPWTHENLILLQRTTSADFFDGWIRIPNVQRFNKQYLMERGETLLRVLKKKVHNSEISIYEYPQEYSYTYNQIGPSRHPVFLSSDLKRLSFKTWKNSVFDGPEFWSHLGFEGWVASQKPILADLLQWWKRKEEIRIKRASGKSDGENETMGEQ